MNYFLIWLSEQREKEERVREEKEKEEKAKEEKIKTERLRAEKLEQEKIRAEKLLEEKLLEEKSKNLSLTESTDDDIKTEKRSRKLQRSKTIATASDFTKTKSIIQQSSRIESVTKGKSTKTSTFFAYEISISGNRLNVCGEISGHFRHFRHFNIQKYNL